MMHPKPPCLKEPWNFQLRLGRIPKRLTIAAGFRFNGGTFLCADSQFSYGGVCKTKGEKIMSGGFNRLPVKIGFALAGDVPKAMSAIRNIQVEIASLTSSASGADVWSAIENAMHRSYRTVFEHPTYNSQTGEGPHFWLLISLWMEGQPSTLLKTHEENVNQVRQFDCAGSGEYLFRYILDDVYTPDMELQEVLTLIIHAFKEIKAYDQNVGFNTEFIAFFNERKTFSRVAGYDIDHMENFGSLTKREFFKYMLAVADLRKTDEQVAKAKSLFEANLVNLRRRYLQEKKHRKNIRELLNILSVGDPGITLTMPTKQSASQKLKRER